MLNIKQINIKNRRFYLYNDMTRIKDLNPDLINIDKKLCRNIDIYYIGYITIKYSNYVNIYSVNPLHFIIDEIDGYIEEKKWE